MASSTSRIVFRIVMVVFLLLVLFYIGRPLYWKISATIHDIRQNKQTVREGLSQIVMEAQRSVGWYHDESDSGVRVTNRKLLSHQIAVVTTIICMSHPTEKSYCSTASLVFNTLTASIILSVNFHHGVPLGTIGAVIPS